MPDTPNRIRGLLPSDDLADLDDWKREMIESTDFGAVYHDFLARFGNHDEFFRRSRTITEPLLASIAEDLASRVLRRRLKVRQTYLMEIPDRRFVHGVVDFGAHSAHLVFFRDELSGLLALTTGDLEGRLLILRVTGSLLSCRPRKDENERWPSLPQ